MDLITALREFDSLTGKPLAALDAAIADYGVEARDIAEGKVQPSYFLISELADVLQGYGIAVETFDDEARWNHLYRAMEESPAFRRYCLEAHGNTLIQINELDNETLDRILTLLQLDRTHTALDLGCGNGHLTESISDTTRASLVGIDVSTYAIRLAQQRTWSKRGRLTFQVGDLNQLGTALAGQPSFDAIIAMEVMYAAKDLASTLRELRSRLRQGGQLLFIANQHIDRLDREDHRLRPEGTDLAVAIGRLGLRLEVIDVTRNKVQFLEQSIALLEKHKAAFEQEGNRDFWAARIIYDRTMLARVQGGLTRRFLYHVAQV